MPRPFSAWPRRLVPLSPPPFVSSVLQLRGRVALPSLRFEPDPTPGVLAVLNSDLCARLFQRHDLRAVVEAPGAHRHGANAFHDILPWSLPIPMLLDPGCTVVGQVIGRSNDVVLMMTTYIDGTTPDVLRAKKELVRLLALAFALLNMAARGEDSVEDLDELCQRKDANGPLLFKDSAEYRALCACTPTGRRSHHP